MTTTFEAPPPGTGRRGAPRTRALAALAADLIAAPGAWARVGEYANAQSANTTASLIRLGRLAAFRTAAPGTFEAEARTVKGKHVVYARATDGTAAEQASTADVTVFEVRRGNPADRPDKVALYATPQAAMDHGAADFLRVHGDAYTVTWHECRDGWESHVADMDGAWVVGDWHIVTVTAPAAYTPAGGEQA